MNSECKKKNNEFPRALTPPKEPIVVIGPSVIEKAIRASRRSPRGRVILPFHKGEGDTLQRMLNALQPGSYIQPHRHATPPKSESILVLRGSICYVTFSEVGKVDEAILLGTGSESLGIDTQAGVYHTFFALEPDTVLFEVKPGPYDAETDKQFAPWAPPEGSQEARVYLAELEELAQRENTKIDWPNKALQPTPLKRRG